MTAAWKKLRDMLADLEQLADEGEPLTEQTEAAAILVEQTETEVAALGMIRQQCLDNGLTPEAADLYVQGIIRKLRET